MVCPIMEVGKWNGTNQRKKEQTDIDVVGLNTVDKKAILGECKFKNSSVDKATLDALQDRAGLIDKKYEIVKCQFIPTPFRKGGLRGISSSRPTILPNQILLQPAELGIIAHSYD